MDIGYSIYRYIKFWLVFYCIELLERPARERGRTLFH